jgi:hypothetical protein
VIARNGGHALNFALVVALQRALGLERRTAGAALRMAAVVDAVERTDGFAPAPATV